jgi:hypothetical protein
VNLGPESNTRSGWDTVRRLERIRGEEERADQRDQEPAKLYLARSESSWSSLEPAVRTTWIATRTYQLRGSELHPLTEVGKFRVVAVHDLAQFAYNGDSSRMQNDLANLSRQGLVKQISIMDSVRRCRLSKRGDPVLVDS